MIRRGVVENKKAQVTIFLIIGIVLIGSIIVFFVIRENEVISIGGNPEENPEAFLNSCISEKLKEAINYISLRGGYVETSPSLNYSFNEESFREIAYICYTQNYYIECVNQKPLVTQDIKQEIKTYISSDMEDCFNQMEQSFEQENIANFEYRDFEVEVLPKRISIKTDSNIILTKSGQAVEYEDLEVNFESRLYEITRLAQEIVNQEARFCYAEIQGISITYPEFIISKFEAGESIIYTINHTESEEEFRFAIRRCVIPPGLGLSR